MGKHGRKKGQKNLVVKIKSAKRIEKYFNDIVALLELDNPTTDPRKILATIDHLFEDQPQKLKNLST